MLVLGYEKQTRREEILGLLYIWIFVWREGECYFSGPSIEKWCHHQLLDRHLEAWLDFSYEKQRQLIYEESVIYALEHCMPQPTAVAYIEDAGRATDQRRKARLSMN